MSNFYSKIEILKNNNLNNNVDLFIKKLLSISENINFNQFVDLSNKLIDSLIDICIKNKINYFINNHISFSSIKSNFKLELENFLSDIVKKIYPEIEHYIIEFFTENLENKNSSHYWNNFLDILSKKSSTKNKVSFNPTAIEYTYKSKENNGKTKKKSKPIKIISFENNIEISLEEKISIYLKIIFTNGLYVENLNYKIYSMCSVLNDSDIEYNIYQPYKLIHEKIQ